MELESWFIQNYQLEAKSVFPMCARECGDKMRWTSRNEWVGSTGWCLCGKDRAGGLAIPQHEGPQEGLVVDFKRNRPARDSRGSPRIPNVVAFSFFVLAARAAHASLLGEFATSSPLSRSSEGHVWTRAAAEPQRDGPSARERAGQNAVAGAVAGFTARMAVAPIDLAKIRLQLQQNNLAASVATAAPKYRSMLQTMRTVASEEGVSALWKGNVPAQLMVMTFVSVKFTTYNFLRDVFNRRDQSSLAEGEAQSGAAKTLINLAAGGMAGGTATSVTYPFDLMRTRLASRTGSTGGLMSSVLLDEARKVWADGGVCGFYKGLGPSLVSIVPYMAIQLSSFEAAKAVYLAMVNRGAEEEVRSLGVVPSTVMGATAGGLSKILTLPLDLCKKRMQMNMVQDRFVHQILARVVREEGLAALWKGGVPAVVKTVPATAITFGVYEVVRAAQMRRFEQRQREEAER